MCGNFLPHAIESIRTKLLATSHRTIYLRTKLWTFLSKSQNVHTADLGYLGFQDHHKKTFSSVASKLREAMPPGRHMQPFYMETCR